MTCGKKYAGDYSKLQDNFFTRIDICMSCLMVDIVTNRAMNDDYKNMSTLNTYCGIFSTCHNYKNKLLTLI